MADGARSGHEPKPLKSKPHPREYALVSGISEIPKTRPELAALAMRVIASWTYIELVRTRMLTSLLDADFATVAVMFDAIRNPRAKHTAFLAALEYRRPADCVFITAIWKAYIAPLETIRNAYAHSAWAYMHEEPDCLTLVPTSALAAVRATHDQFRRTGKVPPGTKMPGRVSVILTEREMQRHIRDVDRAHRVAEALLELLLHGDAAGSAARSSLQAELPSEPAVRSRYSQTKKPPLARRRGAARRRSR